MAVLLWQCTRSLLDRVEVLEARLAAQQGKEMGTIAIQTQCCHLTKADDDDDTEKEEEEGTAVQLATPLPWHERGGRVPAPRPDSPHHTNLSKSPSETSTIFCAPPRCA